MSAAVLESVDVLVLEAETVVDFLGVMRAAQEASGLAPGQIATFTGISRSSVYNWTRPGYPSLPRNRAHVEAFFRCCKLSDLQVRRGLELWERLDKTRTKSVPPGSVKAGKAPVAQPKTADQMPDRSTVADAPMFVDDELVSVTDTDTVVSPAREAAGSSRRAWQFSSILTAVATVAVTVAMMDAVAAAQPESVLSTTTEQDALRVAAYTTILVCAMVIVGLGCGERNRRMAWMRLRNWPAVAATIGMSLAAIVVVAPHTGNPMLAAPIAALAGMTLTAWWFASLSIRGVRLLVTDVPVVFTVCALTGSIPSICIGASGFPLPSAVLAGFLASAAVVHLFGNAAAALAEPVLGPESPHTAPGVEHPTTGEETPAQQPATDLTTTPSAEQESSSSPTSGVDQDVEHEGAREARRRRHGIAYRLSTDWLHQLLFGPACAVRWMHRTISAGVRAVMPSGAATVAKGENIVVPRTAQDLIDRSTQPLPKLPRRKPRSRNMHELLVGVTTVPQLTARPAPLVTFIDEPVERSVPAYEIIERIKKEREQAANAEAMPPFARRPWRAGRRTGSVFGPYALRALVGTGPMGEVYQAYDTVKDRFVAVKLLSEAVALDPVYQLRFRRDTYLAAQLTEPHVIPIHDWGVINGVLFTDTRLVEGTDLRTALHPGPLKPEHAVAIIEQIAAALDAAHAQGLVHRDVKPANIVITETGVAYLTDFGIAQMDEDVSAATARRPVDFYDYVAPERFAVDSVDGRSDIYALTGVLYAALTGVPPFPACTMTEVVQGHLSDPPPRPSDRRATVPAALDEVIVRGMAKDPADRFPTATAMARAARTALTAHARPTPGALAKKIVLPHGAASEFFEDAWPSPGFQEMAYELVGDDSRGWRYPTSYEPTEGIQNTVLRSHGRQPNGWYDTGYLAETGAREGVWDAWAPWRPTI